MTPDELFRCISKILGITELQVKQTPYITLMMDLVKHIYSLGDDFEWNDYL